MDPIIIIYAYLYLKWLRQKFECGDQGFRAQKIEQFELFKMNASNQVLQ